MLGTWRSHAEYCDFATKRLREISAINPHSLMVLLLRGYSDFTQWCSFAVTERVAHNLRNQLKPICLILTFEQ